MINSISFKAKFINPATVMKTTPSGNVHQARASFVELNPLQRDDFRTVRRINYNWENSRSFVSNIVESMEDCLWYGFQNNRRYFALTTQQDNFEKLKEEEVLGITEILTSLSKRIKIRFLQVDPESSYESSDRPFKKAGTAILDSLKQLFPDSEITLTSTTDSVGFYEANGFKEIGSCEFIYSPSNTIENKNPS